MLPSRFKESNFRRFEKVFLAVVDSYPKVLHFDPKQLELSPETFTCRLRDAYQSLITYNWTTTLDLSILKSVWPNIIVNHDGTNVRVGPPVSKQAAAYELTPLEVATTSGATGGELVVENPTEPELLAFALLLNNGRLSLAVRFKGGAGLVTSSALGGLPNIVAQPDGPDLILL